MLTVTQIDPTRIEALSQLAREVFCDTFAHLYPPEDLDAFLTSSYAPEVLAQEIINPAYYYRWVLDETGHPLAYLQCAPVGLPHADADPDCHGELKRLYVRTSAQGKGLGRLLLEDGLAWLDATYGHAPQWIGVWSENNKAQALYNAYGFEQVGTYDFVVGETRDYEFILRRDP